MFCAKGVISNGNVGTSRVEIDEYRLTKFYNGRKFISIDENEVNE